MMTTNLPFSSCGAANFHVIAIHFATQVESYSCKPAVAWCHLVISLNSQIHMAKPAVAQLLVVVVVMSVSLCAPEVLRCPRASPEEIWYSDYSPQLKFTVLEGIIKGDVSLHSGFK